MALIKCPKCGKQFSEHANSCPQCGISKGEALSLIAKQEEEIRLAAEREAAERERQRQEYFAEQERLRKEREGKEAEEARIRAEKRAEWWKKYGKKVWITIAILIVIVLAIITVIKIQKNIAERQLNEKVEAAFLSGDSCVNVFAFEEAKIFYTKAGELKGDKETKDKVGAKFANLRDAEKKAEQEYDAALKKLKILLDADDYEFNQYSNECLDKMVKLNRSRQETIYYLKIRNNPEDQKLLESLSVDGKTSATEQSH